MNGCLILHIIKGNNDSILLMIKIMIKVSVCKWVGSKYQIDNNIATKPNVINQKGKG